MSAFAALVSLRQVLVTVVYLQPRFQVYKRPQLQNLLQDVDSLLNFLESSSSTTSEATQEELESKMTFAAREAERLINAGILNIDLTSLDSVGVGELLFLILSPLPAKLVPVRLVPARLGMVRDWIPFIFVEALICVVITVFLYLRDWIPFIFVEALICVVNAVFLYLRNRDRYCFPTGTASPGLQRLFDDFKIIVEEVNQLEESSSSSLVSLSQILGSIILDCNNNTTQHLKSLHEKVSFLLENAASCNLDAKIRDAVYKAKRALVGFRHPSMSGLIFDWRRFCAQFTVVSLLSPYMLMSMSYRIAYYGGMFPYYLSFGHTNEMMPTQSDVLWEIFIGFASHICSVVAVLAVILILYRHKEPDNQELACTVDDFDIIVRDVMKMKDECRESGDLSDASSSRHDLGGGSGRDVVVGLESDIEEIKARLLQDSSKLEVVSIVGMGGIGKTTLAYKVYHDAYVVDRFDVRAWTTVSPGNTLRHVLLSLLDSARMLIDEEQRKDSDAELGVHLHKHLKDRRYLIVVDDVWDTEIWGFLCRHLPENNDDSRVLLTSRLPDVVGRLSSSSRLHHMQCLDEDHSWNLLCAEVFRAEVCPLEFECIGRKIARRCGGLPLAIIVIGGLLYKDIRSDVWRDVADKLEKTEVQDIKERCLEILGLSYNRLPHHLRPCFLYMGVFLAHREVPISTLIHLWIAEGFLRQRDSKTPEEEAEGYVKDLITRNLISVSKRSCNGEIRRCSMHDLLRDVCVENARKEKFRHFVESGGYVIARGEPDEPPRSLSIDPNAARTDEIHGYLDSLHLRVVNVLGAKFGEFPRRITRLVNLRYLAFQYDGSVPIPPSLSKLQYLETLVLHHSSFGKYSFLPSSIWMMPNLRHIYVKPGCHMFKLLGHQFSWQSYRLVNLQTLVGIRNFEWTKGIIDKLPRLKKLGISYDFSSSADWSTYRLENLVYLKKLESLKIIIEYTGLGSAVSRVAPPKLAFPQSLRKLSLSGCRIPWESMAAIGALPNLEALKLRSEAFFGTSWETVKEEFPRLVFLLLEEMSLTAWESEDSHFPRLQRLILRSCNVLEEIPFSFGDIPTLELIQLVDCHDSAVASAREIQEEQESMGNEVLKFHVEQRRREVDGMSSEARGMLAPGVFEVVYDAMFSTPLEFLVALLILVRLAIRHRATRFILNLRCRLVEVEGRESS